MIDAAIVGIGWWGQKIVTAAQGKSERLRFIRGVSKAPNSVREFTAHHGIALSTELNDVLADPEVQAVVLATPHSLHTEQIIACARSGKAVFCEKPLALKAADAARSVQACKEAGVLLGIGTNKRFWPCMRELRRVVDEPLDSLAAEFDAFVDAAAGRAAYPISRHEMIATIAAFEAVVAAVQTRTGLVT